MACTQKEVHYHSGAAGLYAPGLDATGYGFDSGIRYPDGSVPYIPPSLYGTDSPTAAPTPAPTAAPTGGAVSSASKLECMLK